MRHTIKFKNRVAVFEICTKREFLMLKAFDKFGYQVGHICEHGDFKKLKNVVREALENLRGKDYEA